MSRVSCTSVCLHHDFLLSRFFVFFFFNDTATTEIYTLSLHDALPGSARRADRLGHPPPRAARLGGRRDADLARIVDAARAQGAAGDVLAAGRARWRRRSPTRSRRSCAAGTSPISPPRCPTARRRW